MAGKYMPPRLFSTQELYTTLLAYSHFSSLDALYSTITQQAKGFLEGEYASLFLYEKGEMKRVYTTAPLFKKVLPRKDGLTMQVYKEGKLRMRSAAQLQKEHPLFASLTIGSDVLFPLTVGNKVYGVLSIISPKKQSFKKHIQKLQALSPFIAHELRVISLHEKLAKRLKQHELFIALAAHEIKTPLSFLMLISSALLRGNFPPEKETFLKKRLHESVERLTFTTNAFLQVHNLQGNGLAIHPSLTHISNLLDNVIEQFRNMHPTTSFALENRLAKGKDRIVVDAQKIRLVLTNILNNAIKYSPSGKPITLTLSEKEKYIAISIKDGGLGIETKDKHRIFDKFYQGKNATKPGLGLGLYLVKKIIQKHKGKIHVESEVGKGTTMTILLPAS